MREGISHYTAQKTKATGSGGLLAFLGKCIQKNRQLFLLVGGEILEGIQKGGVKGDLFRSKEFVKRNLQPMTNVGKKLHRGIFISKLNVPGIALGNSGKICKLVGGQISLCSQLCDSFSNVHIVSHSLRMLTLYLFSDTILLSDIWVGTHHCLQSTLRCVPTRLPETILCPIAKPGKYTYGQIGISTVLCN